MELSAASTAMRALMLQSATSAATTTSDFVASALRRPLEALSQQTESTQVRLSAFGQIKSAVADVQTAAKNLQDNKQLQTVDGAKKAAEAFVKAFNAENRAAASLTQRADNRASSSSASSQTAGALADDSRARLAVGDLQRGVSNSQSALKQVGISTQQDGTLVLDSKALEAAFTQDPSAVTQSLKTTGSRLEAAATRQLGASAAIPSAIDKLGSQVANLVERQSNLQALLNQSQQTQEQTQRFTMGPFGGTSSGVFSYRSIFSL